MPVHSTNIVARLDGYQTNVSPEYAIENYTTSSSFVTAPLVIKRKSGWSLSFSCPATGSPNGTFSIEVSNDKELRLDIADDGLVNWQTLTDGGETLSDSVVSDSLITYEDRDPQYRWMRAKYERTSGTITATIRIHTKENK